MKYTEGLSRDKFEKVAREWQQTNERTGEWIRSSSDEYLVEKLAEFASSLKQAPQEYEIMDTSSMKREPAEGKQAETPDSCPTCGSPERDKCVGFCPDEWHGDGPISNGYVTVAESPSRASTQPPKVRMGKVTIRPTFPIEDEPDEISQATKEEWISVADRLPEMDGKLYITFSSGYGELYADKNGIDTNTAQGQAMWYVKKNYPFGISHWMAMPNPPTSKPDGRVRDPIEPSQQEGHVDSKTKEEWARRATETIFSEIDNNGEWMSSQEVAVKRVLALMTNKLKEN